jgi:spermidine/putrescine-binding protein
VVEVKVVRTKVASKGRGRLLVVGGVLALLIAASIGIVNAFAASKGRTTLTMLTWEGDVEPQWVKPFEKANNVTIKEVFVGSDDELFAKMKSSGRSYDLVDTNAANAAELYKQGLLEKISVNRIPYFRHVPAQLQKAENAGNGAVYGAPYIWGSIPLIFDTKFFKKPPTSWSVVYNPPANVCGKVLYSEDAGTAITTVALYLHYKNVYSLNDTQFAKIKSVLMNNKKCVKAYYSGFGDAANYFASHNAVVGLSIGSLIAKMAIQRGASVREIVPKEGAIGWIQVWSVTKKGAAKGDLAYRWMNWMATLRVQVAISKVTNFAPVLPGAAGKLDRKTVRELHLNDLAYLKHLVPIGTPQLPDSWAKRLQLWNEVKAG